MENLELTRKLIEVLYYSRQEKEIAQELYEDGEIDGRERIVETARQNGKISVVLESLHFLKDEAEDLFKVVPVEIWADEPTNPTDEMIEYLFRIWREEEKSAKY